ncbi:MAG: putative bifunctional diguanylate cyclase/phosphodiesterase [Geminicoccales bacterium]
MAQLAAGDHHATVPDLKRSDEIGAIARAVQVFKSNVVERQRAEARMRHMALHDALTDLPNRILFQDRLEQAIVNARRHGSKVALILLDLDWFKDVNDTFGHSAGDQLLKTVAKRLSCAVRANDVVARLGGDEFAIVLNDLTRSDDADIVSRKLVASLDQPIALGDNEAHTPASVGITIFPDDGEIPEQLLQNADVALYRAKALGRSMSCRFDATMSNQVQARKSLEQDLRQALAADQFELYYQPQLDLATGEIVGVEALLRWHHPERGAISPAEFIPIAEETGLIVPIGDWVLRQACTQARAWQDKIAPNITIAVNLSAVQFKSDIAATMIQLLHDYQLPPKLIELEITERIMMRDTDANLTILRRLSDIGIRFSMDDFGTGYASLSYLRRFPFSKIKIDQSFVRDINTKADAAAIVRAVIGLGNSLDMVVTAEGVETDEQLQYLRKAGCTQAQGYFIGKPVPAENVTWMFATDVSEWPSQRRPVYSVES